ncbi:MAG: hypothetical protein ACUX7D_01310 [Candidatus Methanodesulfokora washburnensis]
MAEELARIAGLLAPEHGNIGEPTRGLTPWEIYERTPKRHYSMLEELLSWQDLF